MFMPLIPGLQRLGRCRFLLTTLLSLLPLQLNAQPVAVSPRADEQSILSGQYQRLDSAILEEPQTYSVHLPGHYDPNKTYPVIYLLDGDSHRNKVIGVVEGLTDGILPAMPEVIIVGLDNRKRMRDYTPTHSLTLPNGQAGSPAYAQTGGGAAFLDFIEQELQPRIDADYATSGVNILMGHSFGGLLTLEAARSHRAGFNAFVAIDPSLWFDYPQYYQRLERELGAQGGSQGALFIAAADNPFTPGLGLSTLHRDLIIALGERLQSGSAPGFIARAAFFPGTDHSSVVLPAIESSLRWLFDGYRIPYGQASLDSRQVIDNYTRLSQRLGVEIRPPRERLQFLWAYTEQRLPAEQRTALFQELLQHYYPAQPIEPRGSMAH